VSRPAISVFEARRALIRAQVRAVRAIEDVAALEQIAHELVRSLALVRDLLALARFGADLSERDLMRAADAYVDARARGARPLPVSDDRKAA